MSYISDDNRWKENKWIKVPIIKYKEKVNT